MQLRDSAKRHHNDGGQENQVQDDTAEVQAARAKTQTLSIARLEQKATSAALINHIVREMRSTLIPDEVLQTTVNLLHSALNVSRCLIFRLDLKEKIQVTHVSAATQARQSSADTDISHYLYYHPNLARGHSTVIPRVESQLAPDSQKSTLIVPLFYQQTYQGGISLECDNGREWTEDEITLVEEIASHCAVAIHQAEVYQQARAEIAQRQRQESELQILFQAFPDIYFRLDCSGTILNYCAGEGIDLYVPPEEFLGKRMQDVLPADVGQQLESAFIEVLKTNSLVVVEYLLPLASGEKNFEARLWRSPSNQIIVIARDITKRKQVEAALQKAKAELEMKVSERTRELRNALEQLQKEVEERASAETLLAGQNRVLETIATGAGLPEVLKLIAELIEKESEVGLCSILLLDENKINLRHGAAPSLPDSYNQAIDGIAIGPNVGSCGTAAYFKQVVIVSDIATDVKWEAARDLALSHGLRACFSTPILAPNEDVLGSIALYYRTPRPPNLHDRKLIDIGSRLAGIAISRQQAESALQESKERFRNLVETTSDWVWEVNETGAYTYVSPKVRDLLGYEPQEVLGKTPFDFMIPEEAGVIAKIFGSIAAAQQPFASLENINIHKDGREVILETSGVPYFDANGKFLGYRGIDRDITARKRAEQALKKSENRLRTIIDAEPECVKLIAADGTILEMNAAGIAIIEVEKPEDVIGKSVYPLIVPEYREAFQALNESVCSGNKGKLEFEVIGCSGTRRWMETHAVPLLNDANGTLIQLAISRDITDRKMVELEMLRALEKEKELNELKSRFVTMASHEFRTPLSTILSSTELLQNYSQRWSEEKKGTHYQRIQTCIQHMTHLLNDVLIIGKAEAGKLEFNPAPLNLEEFCRELAEDIQISASKTHAINFVSTGQGHQTYMDEKLLRHIFNNLLSNAVKYSPAGGTVEFKLACQDGEAIFQVQDSGIGIPPEDRLRLFESFHRAKNVGTISGTGLGLAIVKNCVELHGGKITVNSEVGAGTTFTVTIPLNYQLPVTG